MTRIFVLLGALVTAIVLSLVLGGDDAAQQKGAADLVRTSQAKPLPRVVMRRMPLAEHAALGQDKTFTPDVAAATIELVKDGQLELQRLAQVAASDRVPLDLLTSLPGLAGLDRSALQALADGGTWSEAAKTAFAQGSLTVEALASAGSTGLVPERWRTALERIIAAPEYQVTDLSVQGDRLLIRTEILEWEHLGRLEPVGSVEVFDQVGRMKAEWNGERWVLPDHFGKAALPRRMRDVAAWLDGLGHADYRSQAEDFAKDKNLAGDAGSRVILRDQRGETIVDLRVGSIFSRPGEVRTQMSTWVRPFAGKEVYLHPQPLQALCNANLAIWTDTRLFEVEPRAVAQMAKEIDLLVLEYDDISVGSPLPDAPEPTGVRQRIALSQSREAAEPPAPGGEPKRRWSVVEPESAKALELETSLADQLVFQFVNARAMAVMGKDHQDAKYGFQTPIVDLSATLSNGESYKLLIGKEVPPDEAAAKALPSSMKHHYAHGVGSPYVFALNDGVVKALMRKPESFVAPPPPPPPATPEAGPTPVILPPAEAGQSEPKPPSETKPPL